MYMKKTVFWLIIIVAIGAGLVWWINTGNQPSDTATSTDPVATTTDEAVTVTHGTSSIDVDGEQVLSIDDFADSIQVSADSTFGGSERIKSAVLSPDNQWIAIAVTGAAHDFGWVYNRDSEMLRPVAFQYGGGVEVSEWQDNTTVIFDITSPEPDSTQKMIDVTDLPEYPRVATSTNR